MKATIVMPVVIREPFLWDLTKRAIWNLRCSWSHRFILVVNNPWSQSCVSADEVYRFLTLLGIPWRLYPFNDHSSVVQAWNIGLHEAQESGSENLILLANDVNLRADTLDLLLEVSPSEDVAVWGGCGPTQPKDHPIVRDSWDWNLICIPSNTWVKYGRFDESFPVADFGDTDYDIRLLLGGQRGTRLAHIRYDGFVSATSKWDQVQQAHRYKDYTTKAQYLERKWGLPWLRDHTILMDQVRAGKSHKTPFNDPALPLSYWPNHDLISWR